MGSRPSKISNELSYYDRAVRKSMLVERDSHGRVQMVSKPKDKRKHGPTGASFDHPNRPDAGRASWLPSRGDSYLNRGTNRPDSYPPMQDPFHNTHRRGMPLSAVTRLYRDRPRCFEETMYTLRDLEELYEEASWDISIDTGTDYGCTQEELEACGGRFRRASPTKLDYAELRAMWFPHPNEGGPLVPCRTATLDIVQHNNPLRIPASKEYGAIDRLLTMLDDARHGFWGPDVVIKAFCDLDTVFFRGKLRGHVCITWASLYDFKSSPEPIGHTRYLGQSKALIQLNAQYIFLDYGRRPLTEALGTVLHEMW